MITILCKDWQTKCSRGKTQINFVVTLQTPLPAPPPPPPPHQGTKITKFLLATRVCLFLQQGGVTVQVTCHEWGPIHLSTKNIY